MADQVSADISAIAHLEQALAHPEPMCLAVLEIQSNPDPTNQRPPSGRDGSDLHGGVQIEVMEEAERRLRDTLRDYDEFNTVDEYRFVLVLRTLADASIMGSRMENLHSILTRPYLVGGEEVDVGVHLGSAIRSPQDSPADLLARVDQALDGAHGFGFAGQVML